MALKTLALLFALLLPISLQAANTDPLFNGSNGTLILPYLKIGDDVYYVELELVDPVNYLFKVSLSSIAIVTPDSGNTASDPGVIFGTWTGSNYSISFDQDGNYTFTTLSTANGCQLGSETGTYQWEPSTGVFVAVPLQDGNGNCGFSSPGGVRRIEIDGNQFQFSQNGSVSTLLMDSNLSWALTVSKNGNGTGSISSSQQPGINCGSGCQHNFTDGTEVTLTATPDSGSYLFEWGGCDSVSGSGGNICNIKIASNKTVTAKFVSTIMTASIAGTGTGGIISSPAGILCGTAGTDCSFSFPIGTTASLQATASETSFFQSWSGGCTSVTGPNNSICNVTITAGQSSLVTVTASFLPSPKITVGIVGTGNGSVVSSNPGINCGVFGSACSYSFPAGTTASLTATAATGSTFAGWSGGCTSTGGQGGNICNVSITSNQSTNITVDASFVKNP